jgi:hypothetical protein
MSFLCVDVVADVDDALLLENKEETNVFPVCLAEEETFNAFAVALICICLRVRVCVERIIVRKCDVDHKTPQISFVGETNTCVKLLLTPNDTHIHINNGEAVIWSAEEEEEEGERRGCRTGESGGGAFKAWADQVVDRVGVAS